MSKEIKSREYVNPHNQEDVRLAQDYIDEGPINKIPTRTGLFNTTLNRPNFEYNRPEGATVNHNEGAYIVMGQVPMGASQTSGYGALGYPAEAIDLVVGRSSSSNKGKGPKEGDVVNSNHMTDAARIYICRLTDIDRDFNIESHPNDPNPAKTGRNARSGIAVKADNVRIIGREGIKIITGKVFSPHGGAETNSLNGKIGPAPKIDLVAGNNYDNVQGVALGERTAECLKDLNRIINNALSMIFKLAAIQSGLDSVIAIDPIRSWVPAAATPAQMAIITEVLNPLWHTITESNVWEANYLEPHRKRYIVSTNVRTN